MAAHCAETFEQEPKAWWLFQAGANDSGYSLAISSRGYEAWVKAFDEWKVNRQPVRELRLQQSSQVTREATHSMNAFT